MTYLPGMEDIGSEILDQVVEKMNAMIMTSIQQQM